MMDFALRTFSRIAVIGGILGIALATQIATAAWSSKPPSPPNGNVDAPVNIGTANQDKKGGLFLKTLGVTENAFLGRHAFVEGSAVASGATGRDKFGTPLKNQMGYINFSTAEGTTPVFGGSGFGFRNNGGEMQYKDDGGRWKAFVGIGANGGIENFVARGNENKRLGRHDICFLTQVHGRDKDDINGFGCTITRDEGVWKLDAYGSDYDSVTCKATCI